VAIKQNRVNPVIQIDCVISAVERDVFTNRGNGEVQDRGRKLTLVTAQNAPDLEVKVPVGLDDVSLEAGQHALLNVEYMEWSFTDDSGRERSGSTMRLHSLVSPSQVDGWQGLVKQQARAAQNA
jgi:hypothetical protein